MAAQVCTYATKGYCSPFPKIAPACTIPHFINLALFIGARKKKFRVALIAWVAEDIEKSKVFLSHLCFILKNSLFSSIPHF